MRTPRAEGPVATMEMDPPHTAAARVLVAEDEGLLAEELRDRLGALGYHVVAVADTGEAAAAAALALAPDLVLMDIRLKGRLDGIDAAGRIADAGGPPVVYLTAHSDDGTVRRAKRTGPVGYLIKPVGDRELRVTVEMALHRAELERRLRDSEERLAITLTSIGDAVIATDPDGRVTFLNPVAESLLRWKQSEARGLPLSRVFHIVHAITREPVESPVARALREDRVVLLPDNTVLLARDGTEFLIEDSAAPIRDAKRHVRGAVLVFRDLTGQRQAEEAVRKAEDKLRHAQKLEAVGQLAGGVAHDINNLMTVVIGYGNLILEQLAPDHPTREMVEQMKRAGDRAATITRQLLAFSRKQVLAPVVLDLNAVVADMQPMLGRLAGPEVAIRTALAQDLCRIKADSGQVEQVLMNLVVNARDAMPNGGDVTIETRNYRLEATHLPDALGVPPGLYAMLAVTDTGMGMDPVTKSQIFEPFFTTKGVDKGTGLGLSTVYGIVKQSGGHIDVYSELGIGTTFKIYLPHAEGVAEALAKPRPQALPHGTETILLVEDDDSVRKLARQILQGCGYRVLDAADGEEALLICERKTPIHLLLTDAIMPNMTGRVLAQRLHALRPGTRVLFMSGYTEDRILRHEVATARVPFVQKPFTVIDLAEKVRWTLDN